MDRRVIGSVLLAFGAALLVVGANMDRWWTYREGDLRAGAGLHTVTACEAMTCQSITYDKVMTSDQKLFVTVGNIAFYGALVTSALAVLALGFALAKKRIAGPVSPARLATGLAVGMLLAG